MGGGVAPHVFAEVVESIASKSGGGATPRQIVQSARAKNSPIHSLFEWDDTVAAAAHRETQAANYLRAIVVIHKEGDEEPLEVRAFVSVVDGGARSYTSIYRAMSDTEMRNQVIDDAYEELEAWRKKYKDLEMFAELIAVIDRHLPAKKKGKAKV